MRLFQFLIISLFSLLCFTSSNAQVLVSKYLENNICFGPDNVLGYPEVICLAYLEDIGDAKHQLKLLKKEKDLFITASKSKNRLKQKDKRKIERVESTQKSIDREIAHLAELKKQWTVFSQKQTMLQQAYEHQQSDNCLLFKTDQGQLSSEQIELLKLDENQPFTAKEVISVSRTEATTRWERRKTDERCLSRNPDDCFVWCLMEVPEGYLIKDMSKRSLTLEECPLSMSYDSHSTSCYKEYEIEYNRPTARYELVGKMDDNIYEFIGWEAVDCSN